MKFVIAKLFLAVKREQMKMRSTGEILERNK